MPSSLNGFGVTFNDGTTQNTAAGVPTAVAGTSYHMYPPPTTLDQTLSGDPYGPAIRLTTATVKILGAKTLLSGVVRIQWAVRGHSQSGQTCIAYSRIYKNGVAQGTEKSLSVPGSGASALTFYTEDVTVARGDNIDLYGRMNNTSFDTAYFGLNFGISSYTGFPAAVSGANYAINLIPYTTLQYPAWGNIGFTGY